MIRRGLSRVLCVYFVRHWDGMASVCSTFAGVLMT